MDAIDIAGSTFLAVGAKVAASAQNPTLAAVLLRTDWPAEYWEVSYWRLVLVWGDQLCPGQPKQEFDVRAGHDSNDKEEKHGTSQRSSGSGAARNGHGVFHH